VPSSSRNRRNTSIVRDASAKAKLLFIDVLFRVEFAEIGLQCLSLGFVWESGIAFFTSSAAPE
jgi:hypothetical protein